MLSKQSKKPSGLGRLINISLENYKNIQEGFFIEGKRQGLFRILDDQGNYSKVYFENDTIQKV
jgi:hypothetical protein